MASSDGWRRRSAATSRTSSRRSARAASRWPTSRSGHISTASSILANLSMKLGRSLGYVGRGEAARGRRRRGQQVSCGRPYRKPWVHPEVVTVKCLSAWLASAGRLCRPPARLGHRLFVATGWLLLGVLDVLLGRSICQTKHCRDVIVSRIMPMLSRNQNVLCTVSPVAELLLLFPAPLRHDLLGKTGRSCRVGAPANQG